ncbi:hypothetical protein HYQ44_004754 [Verticillium longisporum]|nr:hypothetical protein HYQ44_004754 [Verticillium longisporum]
MAAWELRRLMPPDAGGPLKHVIAPSQAPCNPSPTLPLHPETAAWTLLWRCLGDLVTSAISVNSHHQTPSSV